MSFEEFHKNDPPRPLRQKLAFKNADYREVECHYDNGDDWNRTEDIKPKPKQAFKNKQDVMSNPEDFQKLVRTAFEQKLKMIEDENPGESQEEFLDPYHLYYHTLDQNIIYEKDKIVRQPFVLKNYVQDEPLLLETYSGQVYDGQFVRTDICVEQGDAPMPHRLILRNMSEFPHINRGHPYHYHYFYSGEIKDIRILPHYTPNNACPALQGISYEEFLFLKEHAKHNNLHTLMDCRFKDVIQKLKMRDVISLVALGTHMEKVRNTKISFLAIATPLEINIFDLITSPIRFLDCGLRAVLEDPNIQKVVYDAKMIGDILWNRYQVKMENVFDIGIGDYCLRKKNGEDLTNKDLISFPELADKYLNLPRSTLEHANNLHFEYSHFERPCSEDMRRRVALTVAFILPIYRVQRAKLTSHFHQASNLYSNIPDTNQNEQTIKNENVHKQKFDEVFQTYRQECKQRDKRNAEGNRKFDQRKTELRNKMQQQIDQENILDEELLSQARREWGEES